MKRVLKVGDTIYGISLQNIKDSYLIGFPQREQYLLRFAKNIDFVFFRHNLLAKLNTIFEERQRLNNFLRKQKFDYILVDNPLSILVIDENNPIPIVFDCIDWYDEMYLKEFGVDGRYYLLRFGYIDILNRAQKVICQSPLILDSLKKWGLKTKDYIVIPNGYDATIFYPYTQSRLQKIKKDIQGKYQVSFNDKKIIVYTGKISSWYDELTNIALYIDNNELLFIVGDGPLFDKVPNRENIIKCGRVDLEDVPSFTNIADVLVFPVSEDCSPIAISEYLAVGKPIVMPYGRMEWLLTNMTNVCFVEKNKSSWREGIENAYKIKDKTYNHNIRLARKLSWQTLSMQFCDFLT